MTHKFISKEDALNKSEELSHLWAEGKGMVTGPFMDQKTYKAFYHVEE